MAEIIFYDADLCIDCRRTKAFLDYNTEHFYLRIGPSTTELSVSNIYTYINRRFYIQDESFES